VKRRASLLALPLLLVLACSSPEPGGETPAEDPAPGSAAAEEDGEIEPQSEELRTVTVEVYFPSAAADGLVGEFREIFDTATPGDRIKQIIADLISGPTTAECLRAVTPGTRLRQVYVLPDGTAYLDFSSELTEGVAGGSMTELLTVYSIVDSVAFNLSEVQRVAILVNGRPIETMNGHLDLRRPLKPNASWILGSIVVDGGVRAPGVAAG
jgi:spore germination protein GerM